MPSRPNKVNRPWKRERTPFARDVDRSGFYNSRRWRKTSLAYRDAHPFCESCGAQGKVSAAEVCDHKRGLGFLLQQGIDPHNWDELQSLCHPCHNSKSGKESHGIRN